jgi:signal peptide peptidase SppA
MPESENPNNNLHEDSDPEELLEEKSSEEIERIIAAKRIALARSANGERLDTQSPVFPFNFIIKETTALAEKIVNNTGKYMFNLFKSKVNRVAVIELNGVVSSDVEYDPRTGIFNGISGDIVRDCLEEATELADKISVLVLKINSPGGSPTEAEKIGIGIERFRDKTGIPVFAFIQDMGASAAYWIAATCDMVSCYNTSIVGSIGVIMDASFGLDKVIKKYGVSRRLYTAGDKKGMLDQFSEVKASHKKHIKENLDSTHKIFIDHVKKFREGKLDLNKESEIFSGAWFNGIDALELGLVDGIVDLADCLDDNYGDNYEIITISPDVPKRGLLSLIFGKFMNTITASFSSAISRSFAKLFDGKINRK